MLHSQFQLLIPRPCTHMISYRLQFKHSSTMNMISLAKWAVMYSSSSITNDLRRSTFTCNGMRGLPGQKSGRPVMIFLKSSSPQCIQCSKTPLSHGHAPVVMHDVFLPYSNAYHRWRLHSESDAVCVEKCHQSSSLPWHGITTDQTRARGDAQQCMNRNTQQWQS